MKDPYRVLEVPHGADPALIKQAYRRLAKLLHPDRNPGNERAAQRFREVTEAYDLLSDPVRRTRYDRGEIDSQGRPRHASRGFEFAGDPQRAAESIFGRMFGGTFGRGFGGGFEEAFAERGAEGRFEKVRRRAASNTGPRQPKSRGPDRRIGLEVDFLVAARGGKQRLELDRQHTVEVTIPAGAADGDCLRLKGQGEVGLLGGTPGDALVEIAIRPHPLFTRRGRDIHVEVPISVPEAVLGAGVDVPTIDGSVRMTVPAGSNSGRTLRLKGRGVGAPDGRRGDQYVRLLVVLPEGSDAELEQWARRRSYTVRRNDERT
jgi:DnaJ-class molecular chaperone